jgi:hypothetical protein
MADIMSRASSFKFKKSALKEIQITFGYLHTRGADTVFDALLALFMNDTQVQFAAMDDAITLVGAQGIKAYMECSDMSQEQPQEGGVSHSFTLDLAFFDEGGTQIAPSWYEVSA